MLDTYPISRLLNHVPLDDFLFVSLIDELPQHLPGILLSWEVEDIPLVDPFSVPLLQFFALPAVRNDAPSPDYVDCR